MKCPEAVRLLNGYVDDQLDAASVLALEGHLRGCARCRHRAEGLRAMREAIRRHTEYFAAPAALHARLRQRFGASDTPGAASGRWRVGLAAAAAVAGLAVGMVLWRAGAEPSIASLVRPQAKVVYHMSSSHNASAALRTLGNHLDASPGTKVVVVAHNEGVDFLLRGARDESGALYESVVRRFQERGVEFRVCNNTLVRRKIGGDGIIPEATLVPSGIAEIGRLQKQEGFAYMRM